MRRDNSPISRTWKNDAAGRLEGCLQDHKKYYAPIIISVLAFFRKLINRQLRPTCVIYLFTFAYKTSIAACDLILEPNLKETVYRGIYLSLTSIAACDLILEPNINRLSQYFTSLSRLLLVYRSIMK